MRLTVVLNGRILLDFGVWENPTELAVAEPQRESALGAQVERREEWGEAAFGFISRKVGSIGTGGLS